ncbi:hypothetical protein [Algoriphagus litoralis]|uniref:hypothetical protein n=1 Tax=Algoriphagus litoralis TaxID=2202829 RepID=UPI00130088C8|nr:hypothetical protein [Algoriphagus litoralis]
MKKLFATVTLFAFFAFLPISCGLLCRDSCGCGPSPKLQEIRIKSLSVSTVDKSGVAVVATEGKAFDQVFKSIRIDEVEFLAEVQNQATAISSFGTAFACSPIPPKSVNALSLIQVINEKEFTTSNGVVYAEGDDISSLFGVNYFFGAELTALEDFLEGGLELYQYEDLKVGLLQNPEKELNLEFKMRLVFDDAQEFVLSNQLLSVK